jgi:transposase
MALLAELVDGVIGVDTHRDTLTAAAVTNLGGVLAQTTTSADAAGYQQLLGFARGQVPGRRRWAVEGTGSFGAGLTAALQQHGERVVEVGRDPSASQPQRCQERRAGRRPHPPVRRWARTAWPARAAAASGRRYGCCLPPDAAQPLPGLPPSGELKALIVGAPEELRAELRGRGTSSQVAYCAGLRARPARSLEHRATVRALRAAAQRIQFLQAEADQLQAELSVLVGAAAPWLLEVPGVGPLSAAQVLVSWSHAGRFRLRGGLCRPGRGQPDPCLLRAGDPLPPQPRR